MWNINMECRERDVEMFVLQCMFLRFYFNGDQGLGVIIFRMSLLLYKYGFPGNVYAAFPLSDYTLFSNVLTL